MENLLSGEKRQMLTSTMVAELIQQAKEKQVVGCFPLYPPVELFSSMGLLPVVLWNLKGSIVNLETSDKHIQQYACGIARELAQFAMSDTGEMLDAIFSYNACDTLRNLPEIFDRSNTLAGRNIPMFRMHLPQVDRSQCNPEEYLENEVVLLIHKIEEAFNTKFSKELFYQMSKKYFIMRKLCCESEKLVAKGLLTFESFCRVVLSGYALPVETHINHLKTLIDSAKTDQCSMEKKVVISGIMPPPPPVIQALENKNMRVVANDIASLSRSYAYNPEPNDDPIAFYSDLYARRFPCTTLLYTSDARKDAVLDMVSESGAQGVIFCGEKFCEHEYFEFPYMKKQLNERNISTLFLEFSADDMDHIEAHITRVEAFSEMI